VVKKEWRLATFAKTVDFPNLVVVLMLSGAIYTTSSANMVFPM
jgi:hypothetical protein